MKEEPDALRFSLSAVLEYYDVFAWLVIRDANRGGWPKCLIAHADVALRTEMCRANEIPRSITTVLAGLHHTLQPGISADELSLL